MLATLCNELKKTKMGNWTLSLLGKVTDSIKDSGIPLFGWC